MYDKLLKIVYLKEKEKNYNKTKPAIKYSYCSVAFIHADHLSKLIKNLDNLLDASGQH